MHVFCNEAGERASILLLFVPGAREDYFETLEKFAHGFTTTEEECADFVSRCAAFADLGIDHVTVITTGPWTAEGVATLVEAADRSSLSAPLPPSDRPNPCGHLGRRETGVLVHGGQCT
ncbi:hypothetical protein A6A27_30280 [Micromonospora sp. CB01531]|nr:hypothetical protein A6A27_30280 [Micromonospora sp. CB01531]